MDAKVELRGLYAGPVSKKLDIPVTRDLLERLGKCMVDSFAKEAKKDFAKRGWSGKAEDGSAPIWDSFSYHIKGDRTVEVTSTYPHIDQLVEDASSPHKMTWLTQEAKNTNPSSFPLTPRERKLGMKRAGKVSEGGRLPLVVPLKAKDGTVIFRTAPLTFQDAWVHPGIARFTFVQRAAKQGREQCIALIKQEVLAALVQRLS